LNADANLYSLIHPITNSIIKKMAKTTQKTTAAKTATANTTPVKFIFDKSNYTWFIIAIAVVAFGFVLMSGTTDIYSTTKIVIAPVMVLAGFGIGFYAILKKPDNK
jgi:F0F1-type ATP synthase assembly protein I